MSAQRAKKLKKSFTLIEILVVISLVMSISIVLMTSGSSFIKNYQVNQEKKLFEAALARAHCFAKIHSKPIEACLTPVESKGVLLQIKPLKFSKIFKYLHYEGEKLKFYLMGRDMAHAENFGISFY